MARYGEMWGGMGRYGEVWGGMGRYREVWRDMAPARRVAQRPDVENPLEGALHERRLEDGRAGRRARHIDQDLVQRLLLVLGPFRVRHLKVLRHRLEVLPPPPAERGGAEGPVRRHVPRR